MTHAHTAHALPTTTREWEQYADERIAALYGCFAQGRHQWPTPHCQQQAGRCTVCHHLIYCPAAAPQDLPTSARPMLCPVHAQEQHQQQQRQEEVRP